MKDLFDGGALTYEQFMEKTKDMKLVNLSDGGYVSIDKYNDKLNASKEQVDALQSQLTERNTDIEKLKSSFEAVKGDANRLGEVTNSLAELQAKYEEDKKAYEQRLSQQSYEYSIRERANSLHFSSVSAKKAFINDAISKEFKQDGDSLLGYDEFVAKYKADDPMAFKDEVSSKPNIVLPTDKPDEKASGWDNFKFYGVRKQGV